MDEPYFHWEDDGFTVDILGDRDVDVKDLEVGDSIITLSTGERYSALLITMEELVRIMDRHARSGESLSGRYFCAPDLVVMKEKGVISMIDVIRDILQSGDVSTLPRIGGEGRLVLPEM
ncbi:hypothetical protein SAMN05421874_109158 [Nonomuraea maritima]|uniref:Uncharacterized protein n=1 Tax=Nonomuraea maritima TaxID=683260 RepID=A0A1G9DIQ6_9ACTN|nr:hypothetical protein [Nonomuraea maritima]SDK63749.1 hypothetical protein SAMN05421874_109158 [Nonomuraea maritima]